MSTRKNISFKNGRVLEAYLSNPEGERSNFIERCVLYYLDSIEKEYITREEVEEMFNDYSNGVEILNENYEQVKIIVEEIARSLFK